MPITLYARTDIRRIIESLPAEEIEHMFRVGMLVGIMASKTFELGFCLRDDDKNKYQYYGRAAFYHDIGKAWVPRSILTKPGRLTKEETALMNKHPEHARNLFDKINDGSVIGMPGYLVQSAFESAVYHHEWWNGAGHPYGIRENEIPLIARITSICDAYDAITSKRSYSNARTHYAACRELQTNAGTQFDPELVGVFLDYESAFSLYIQKMVSWL